MKKSKILEHMDFLLYFYFLLFGMILILPFLVFYLRGQGEGSPFRKDESEYLQPYLQKRENLLDSLKDLRSDFSSGKITEEEFKSNSLPLLGELESLETSKEQMVNSTLETVPVKIIEGWQCQQCGAYTKLPNAKFCPECGASRYA
ncbi:zinc ribbon domain-containing protein [Leptospira ryugenii]|nr:zinc ribbon domain-containing protein [Leptospira ryugenii]